ncbi:PucR family transcriptional regulator [Bacillus sp. 03113]|uniref:PucR family transcriptional regulator n=1 Tax=Bacillus sp. 03113 TaxID=2578211 RepID=UPI001142D092|nr:PucR family transcriptional regulator [Bacillus sp. 03113]
MKMKELLETPIFKEAKIVSGEEGLDRKVQSVNMMDAPDIIDFLKPHELLLTTAYYFHDNPDEMVRLVKQMSKKECSGLAIKTRRFLKEIPENVILASKEENFPIIELPFDYSLGEIVNESLNVILEKKTNELEYALNTHRKFTKLVHKGEQLSKIIESLSSLLNKPVLLIDHLHNITVQTHHFRNKNMKESVEHILQILKENRPIHSSNPVYFSVYYPESLRKSIVQLLPIETYVKKNYLVIFGLEFPFDAYTLLNIEQVANVISFELLKQQAISEHMLHMKSDYLNAFLDGEIPQEEILKRGKDYGLEKDHQYIVVTCQIDQNPIGERRSLFNNTTQSESYKQTIYEHLNAKLLNKKFKYTIFTKRDLYIIIFSVDIYEKQVEQRLKKLLFDVQKEMDSYLNISLSFGIGSYADNISAIPTAYRHSYDALETGYRSGKTNFIQRYRAKDITELLKMIPMQNLKEFYESSLKGIAYSTNKDNLSLIQTLTVYLENHCQIADTAKQLYVHRNTVIYRLEKCEELLGVSLKEPDETLRLRIALLIRSFIL